MRYSGHLVKEDFFVNSKLKIAIFLFLIAGIAAAVTLYLRYMP